MSEPTDTITIRVPVSLKRNLENMCQKNQMSLNLLINQILTKNSQWDEHLTKMGWLQFNPAVVKSLFEFLNEQQMSELAKSTKHDIINGIKFIYGDTSLQHTSEFIQTWLNSTNIPFRYNEDSNSHKFLVNHILGKNWSMFAVKISKEFVSELGYEITDLHVSDDSYSFTILK
ncbi:hypothetical protein [Nitrosopumilus sp. S4]